MDHPSHGILTTGLRSHRARLKNTRKGVIKAVHSLYDRICGPILYARETIPIPPSRLAWPALGVTENQTALPILPWQIDLVQAKKVQRAKDVI